MTDILRVLKCLREHGGSRGMTVAEVSADTSVPVRSCSTYLCQLTRQGRVEVCGKVQYPQVGTNYKHTSYHNDDGKEYPRKFSNMRRGGPSNLYKLKRGPE